jgi:hypothetical protein
MSTFKDAIIQAVRDAAWWDDQEGTIADSGDAVLDMPEMQAICKALHGMAWDHGACLNADHVRDQLRQYHVPEHVIDWVLAEPTT